MAAELRLLSFNVRFGRYAGARLTAAGEQIENERIDVVVLQEVMHRAQVKRLQRVLTSFPHSVSHRTGPMVRAGLVIFSRWPVERQDLLSFGRAAARPSLDQWLKPKGALIVHLRVNNQAVVIIDTHLQHNPLGNWSHVNRYTAREQFELQRLAGAIGKLSSDSSLVVAGDFNVPAGSWLLDEFLASTGLRDAMGPSREPTYNRTSRVRNPQAIDHVLVRQGRGTALAVAAKLVFRNDRVQISGSRSVELSDHCAILATVSLS